jgi:hypothetical protein
MKTTFYIFLFCFLFGMNLSIQAQDAGTVSVKLNSANLRGQTLSLDLDMRINHIYVAPHASLSLTLALQNGNNIIHLPPVVLNGSNKRKMFERAVELKGLEAAKAGAYAVLKNDENLIQFVPYKYSIAYRPWMNRCQLVLVGEVLDYDNNPIDTFTDVLQRSLVIRGR